jgi:opacity protein-like surface antigen
MKKSYGVVLIACLSLVFAGSAFGQMYFGTKAGYVMTADSDLEFDEGGKGTAEWDPGFGLGVAMGYAFGNFRVEGEVEYRSTDLDKAKVDAVEEEVVDDDEKYNEDRAVSLADYSLADASSSITLQTWSLMANAYYDVDLGYAVKPFIGAGLGLARHDISNTDEVDVVFAYQGTAGLGWDLSDKTTLELAYRYFLTSDAEFDGVESMEYSSHNFTVGVRFEF